MAGDRRARWGGSLDSRRNPGLTPIRSSGSILAPCRFSDCLHCSSTRLLLVKSSSVQPVWSRSWSKTQSMPMPTMCASRSIVVASNEFRQQMMAAGSWRRNSCWLSNRTPRARSRPRPIWMGCRRWDFEERPWHPSHPSLVSRFAVVRRVRTMHRSSRSKVTDERDLGPHQVPLERW